MTPDHQNQAQAIPPTGAQARGTSSRAPRLTAMPDRDRWHALCGTRLYCIETLAGTFPDMGWHQPLEMGGIWAPPIKLLDGYWIGVREPDGELRWLDEPTRWELGDDGATFTYEIPALELRATRRAWIVPDESVLVIDLTLARLAQTATHTPETFDVAFVARSDLQGAWRSDEQLGLLDGQDDARFDEELRAVMMWDTRRPEWSACVGATMRPQAYQIGRDVWGPEHTTGRGVGALLWYRCAVSAAETPDISLRMVVAGPARDGQPASTLFARYTLAQSASDDLEAAHRTFAERFQQPLLDCVLRTPDPALDEAFGWAKATASWMMLESPQLGRGPMAGLADFPWWFGCDTAFGVLALLPFGQGHEAAASLRTWADLSWKQHGNGRVLHEMVTNGVIIEPGNLVEIPLFARALYHTYRWTGDRALLEQVFPFCLEGVLGYALGAELEPGEFVPQGRSMAETPDAHGGVQALDVGAYLVEALDLLSALAHDLGRDALAEDLRTRAERIRDTMRADWWLPADGLFGELRASVDELTTLLARFEAIDDPDESVRLSIQRLRGALAAPQASTPPREQRQLWRFGHYIHALAAEAGLPTRSQGERALARLETPEWTSRYGLVLNAHTDRRVMTLPTGAMALAEARYGRPDAALDYIQRLVATTGQLSPGTMSEFSPAGGCFLQFWSSYGVVWPIVHEFFGIRPDIAHRRVTCAPNPPSAWPTARLDAIPLGDAQLSCAVTATERTTTVRVTTTDPRLEVTLGVVGRAGLPAPQATLDGMPVTLTSAPDSVAYRAPTWLAPSRTGATEYTLTITWQAAPTSATHAETSSSLAGDRASVTAREEA